MNKLVFLLSMVPFVGAFGQGQIRFETLGPGLDAPVTRRGIYGPGPNFSAQLWLADMSGNAVKPLSPATTFRAAGSSGMDVIADRYVNPVDVTVPNVPPGSSVMLIMRVWLTSLGSFENAEGTCYLGQSGPFTITLGGGDVPPAPMTTVTAFTVGGLECPSGRPQIIGISFTNNQVVIAADQVTGQARLLASTNLQTWTDLNLTSTQSVTSRNGRIFSFSPPLPYQYFRLEEP